MKFTEANGNTVFTLETGLDPSGRTYRLTIRPGGGKESSVYMPVTLIDKLVKSLMRDALVHLVEKAVSDLGDDQ